MCVFLEKITPVYTFGEEMSFKAFPYFLSLRLWLNKFKIPGVLFRGEWWCFFMPIAQIPLITVVGKPIQVPKIDEPTKQDIDKYHKQYMIALQELFDKYKVTYAMDPKAELKIF
jgi:hypothetical protein